MSEVHEKAVNDKALALHPAKLNLCYGTFQALFDIDLQIKPGIITSMIGPSGCGKSTFLRSVNRINERLGYVRITGAINVMGHNVYDPDVELVQVRKQVGMVFQRPNPLPVSVRENVLFGHRLHAAGSHADHEEIVENALRQVLLWDKVKDRLENKATTLSLEEQQKLCIARLLPVKPGLLLMDEPCSALDPKGTEAVEDLIWELRPAKSSSSSRREVSKCRSRSRRSVANCSISSSRWDDRSWSTLWSFVS